MKHLKIIIFGVFAILGLILGAGTIYSSVLIASNPTEINGCANPISDASFTSMIANIEKLDFESEKIDLAKNEISTQCLSAKQLKNLVLYFDFETTKLDLAKYAYQYVHDPANFNALYDTFELATSIDELKKHIGQ